MRLIAALAIISVATDGSILPSEKSSLATHLKSIGGWDYYKVNVSGTMSSFNVKTACENAGFVAPCPGPMSSCRLSGGGCNDTNLPNEKGDCSGWFDLCNGNPPQRCEALRGVYMYYHNWQEGSACGVVEGAYYPFNCQNGNYKSNKLALCAKPHETKPLKEKLLMIDSLLHEALDDLTSK